VIGPDEYHVAVDDNAFTNVMARWNLRAAADLVEANDGGAEARRWRILADALVDGWDAERGVYEQFAGYFGLDPLIMTEIAEPPVPADILLGPDRVTRSQLIKQADVLMLHHLIPSEVVEGSLARCLEFYEPRTAHGSSLSPAISASLLARAGQPERALALFRLASRLDLDDTTSTTAGGLHMATLGGLWQALAYGFLGLRVEADELCVSPCLPAQWDALGLTFWFRGVPVKVRAERGRVSLRCSEPVRVRLPGRSGQVLEPPGAEAAYAASEGRQP
jgi:trehalose/maltose hydrolase-like predicted phosphorylase